MARIFVALPLCLLIIGCSLFTKEASPEDVDKAASLFFERLKSAEYDKIYNDSSKSFKEKKSRPEVVENLKQITAIGRLQDYNRLSMTFNKQGDKPVAFPSYSVLFDQARAEIILTLIDDGGEWKLLGFEVRQRGA